MCPIESDNSALTILCLANLAWEQTLFQRPQQLMSRFSRRGHQVLYAARVSSRRWARMKPQEREAQMSEGVGRAVNLPYYPLSGRVRFFNDLTLRRVLSQTRPFIEAGDPGTRVLWLQHPDYIHIANELPHDLLVYDAMDPFEHFDSSSTWIAEREKETLKRAQILFTGGRSLHRQREHLHRNAYCYPSGIDFDHFSKAAGPGMIPEDLQEIGKPIIGYTGAIDRERIDWELVDTICRAKPNWKIVFIGPLIGMQELPVRAQNIFHLGARPYSQLPDYLRGFDAAMIPWQINDLTSGMSPTKTPEYLAAGRPVVSTAIPDVVADYGNDVLIADSPESFIAQCEAAINKGSGEALKPPQAKTWDEIAGEMEGIMRSELKA